MAEGKPSLENLAPLVWIRPDEAESPPLGAARMDHAAWPLVQGQQGRVKECLMG